jgi:hypothetical protein
MPDLLLRHISKQLFDLAEKHVLSERGLEKEGLRGRHLHLLSWLSGVQGLR